MEAGDGRTWTLRGVKDVRARRLLDLWPATTRLAVQVEPQEGDDAPLVGELRLGVPAVARMLASMRPVPAARRSDGAVALARFLGFFAGTLARLYVAGRRAGGR